MIKKRGRPKGKKNAPKFTLLPLSIIKMVAQDQELIPVCLDWLSAKGGVAESSLPQSINQEESSQKVEYKITEFEV